MSKHEEFVHFEAGSGGQAVSEVELEPQDNRREHQRFSLRLNPRVPLALACDGIRVKILKTNWFLVSQLGTASVKDLSISGVGLLSSVALVIGQHICLEFEQGKFWCEVTRTHRVQGRLNFFGARWLDADTTKVLALIHSVRPQLAD
ncbi:MULTISPECIES: pilus assembly protein PilZ [Shewanella]|uniref:Pilus assembly protein PilZ n=1 Tax=Shewanella salipaludis TaxID=2723052 RepID=A0A972FV65_9GAMM|nr:MULTISPECIES: pilus assembly protein PilZ [Shewanella]MCE9686212.1 pilus assembly protein PilZ [Shewanella sp. AS16]NMH66715.1 pilus assembly protein PilZ [Shewanella salipaludis]